MFSIFYLVYNIFGRKIPCMFDKVIGVQKHSNHRRNTNVHAADAGIYDRYVMFSRNKLRKVDENNKQYKYNKQIQ